MPSSITFTCQTITPMLMHGADGSSAELRPASIKGVLRFWWRAIHGDLSLDDLHRQEGEIFGNTEGRSSFSIRIKPKILTSKSQNALPHRPKPVNLNGFKENQTFEVTISGQNLELIKNLFILATTLGGFGQRSRRGFGSVKIVGSEVLTSPKEISFPKSLGDGECFVLNGNKNTIGNKNVVILEEYSFEVTEKLGEVKTSLPKELFDTLQERIVIISDDNFTHFVKNSTEVITRIKMNNKTGTVDKDIGGLFTEEFLPSESVMYALAIGEVEKFTEAKITTLQIGGDTNLGKGIVEMTIGVKVEAKK